MLLQGFTKRIVVVSCVLVFAAFGESNANGQSRDKAQPIDWGRTLDLSPKNTETKPERLGLQKELELGRQIREQNDRERSRLEGRGTDQGAAVNAPNIEMRGVFERDKPDRPDRSNDSDRQYSPTSQSRPPQVYPGDSMRYVVPGSTPLTRAEVLLYTHHPDLVPTVNYIKTLAENETVKRFGVSQGDDASDAFRHAYASALLSRKLGPYAAQAITDAHEMYSDNPPRSRSMDLYNNRVGIGMGQSYLPRGDTEKQLADIAERAARNGWLVILRQ
jgi:hypothetical protein